MPRHDKFRDTVKRCESDCVGPYVFVECHSRLLLFPHIALAQENVNG